MADWNLPVLTSAYSDWLAFLKARDLDTAKMFIGVTITNPVADMVQFSTTNHRWERYNGSSWAKLDTAFALDLGSGSTVNATPIGATSASTAKFTTLESSGMTKLATAGRLLVGGAADDGATALQVNGAVTFTTQATGDNSTKGATTAFVKAQGYATLASPALTGTPTVPTAAVNTNTTQAASTAFVLGQAATATPAALGTAAVGTATRFAREDHVHLMPTLDALSNTTITANTSGEILKWNGTSWINNTLAEAGIAPADSPTLTGTPTAPTAAFGTNNTQLATTAFVQASVPTTLAVQPNASTTLGTVIHNYPGGGTYQGGSAVTGALKIALPAAGNGFNSMMRMRVEIFDYGLNESLTMLIAGYRTSAGVWSMQTVTTLTEDVNKDFTVRFGSDASGGCLWIGELATVWSYVRVHIAEVMVTYNADGNNTTRWASGWAISAVTAFDTVEDTISSNLPVAKTAAALTTARTISLAGDVTGSVSFNGTANVSITAAVVDDSHNHTFSTVTGLQTALDAKAPLASPALTGVPTAPTAATATNTTQVATTAFVKAQAYAPLASPALTGIPTVPTAAVDTNTTQAASTAFVIGQGYAKLASPALTGVPTAPTAALGTSTTQVATTEFVGAAVAGMARGQQQFLASGTFTVPAGVTEVYLTGIAGGGGGGGSDGTSSYSGLAGGGGYGLLTLRKKVTVVPGTDYVVTVGAGGAGGAAGGSNGGAGGATSFGALLSLAGGGGGAGAAGTSGGNKYGAGGAPGGEFGEAGKSGWGGCTPFGGGGAGRSNSSSGAGGGASANTGAGGGGAASFTTTGSFAGGAGGSGYLLVEW